MSWAWIEQSEGAKFWLRVMNELKNRGVDDRQFAVVDGLKGFPDAITAVFPKAIVHGPCIVHLIRHSLSLGIVAGPQVADAGAAVGLSRRDPLEIAAHRLGDFEAEWEKYPAIGLAWAARLERGHPVLRLSAADQKDDLHHQRHREPASSPAQDNQGPRRLPIRRGSDEAALPGTEETRRALETCHRVANRLRAVTIFFPDRLPTTTR